MASEMVQLNTRIDARMKREGDAVFARCGVSSSAAVRALWAYVAENQALPEFMQPSVVSAATDARIAAVREGAGLACRVATQQGVKLGGQVPAYDELRSEMYDELAKEYAPHA